MEEGRPASLKGLFQGRPDHFARNPTISAVDTFAFPRIVIPIFEPFLEMTFIDEPRLSRNPLPLQQPA